MFTPARLYNSRTASALVVDRYIKDIDILTQYSICCITSISSFWYIKFQYIAAHSSESVFTV